MDKIPTIHVEKMPAGYYNLYLDGKKIWFSFSLQKKSLERYLKRNYDVDLRTDPRITKNYKEFTTRKISEKNGQKFYIKKQLNQ